MKIIVNEGKASIYTPYNAEFVRRIKKIGGSKWNSDDRCWIVPESTVESCREIMQDVYGETDISTTKKVDIRITFIECFSELCGSVTMFGKTIARAYGRDSGAKSGDDVAFISGLPESGGSVKNWKTIIPKGCVVDVYGVPEDMLSDYDKDYITVEIKESRVNKAKLLEERDRLMKRIEEINTILNGQ